MASENFTGGAALWCVIAAGFGLGCLLVFVLSVFGVKI